MGVAYRAEDTRLARPVAIKFLARAIARQRRERQRLEQEARAAARLTHPNVAAVYALEQDGDTLFIVSEYVRGTTLRRLLAEGPAPPDRGLEIALELADAMAAAHALGIVHRDLQPENIMMTPAGHVKVLDFGLARFEDADETATRARLTTTGAVVGTVAYMSPEQLHGLPVDFRSDIFSFGVILYELLTGTHPFERRSAATTIANITGVDAPALPPRARQAFDAGAILERRLRKEPAKRSQATADLVADLQAVRQGTRPAAADQAKAPSDARFGAGWWWRAHQVHASVVYWIALTPLWALRQYAGAGSGPGGAGTVSIPRAWASLALFGTLAVIVVLSTLRWHLLFTARVNERALAGELKQVGPWLQRLDWTLSALLLLAAVFMAAEHQWWSALAVGLAVGFAVGSTVIEPTTKAAFRRAAGRRSGTRKRTRVSPGGPGTPA